MNNRIKQAWKSEKTWRAGSLVYTTPALVAVFFWLLFGDFSWSMRDRSVGPMSQWFLSNLGVSNIVFALLISTFPALIGLFLGPIISVKSDRHRGRRGRRIPFLLVSTPLAALGMIGIGLSPVIAGQLHALLQPGSGIGAALHGLMAQGPAGQRAFEFLSSETAVSVACFAVFWSIFEIATIVAQSVFGGLLNDVVPRELLGRFFGLFRAVSLVDGMVFNFWIMGWVPTHFTVILIIVGLTYGTAFLWMCFKVREGTYPPPEPLDNSQSPLVQAATGVRVYFRESFSNPYYLSIFLLIAAGNLVFAPVNLFAIPFAKSVGVDMAVYGKFLTLTYFISLCLAYFIGWLADVYHPLRVVMAALAGYLLLSLYGAYHATTPGAFLVVWVLHGVLGGCYATGAASLGQKLFPRSKFAQFASAAGIVGSLASSSLAPLMGLVIDHTGNTYRHTFAGGALLAILALSASVFVYRGFVKLGGPRNYTAPE